MTVDQGKERAAHHQAPRHSLLRWAVIIGIVGAIWGAVPHPLPMKEGYFMGVFMGSLCGIGIGVVDGRKNGLGKGVRTFFGVLVGLTIFFPVAVAFQRFCHSVGLWAADGYETYLTITVGGLVGAIGGAITGTIVGFYLRKHGQEPG